ncbi:hypothetical protein Q8G28_17750 [Lysinibacillus capsici]|uniref:hypothetical protein n=1 Tax=Lysinibacillus capsici TaxID=2115968 RepID=UPI0027312957|nr:hypothetical protein [Lysinibacillus capsici]MDP1395266.1 hypothetical protein [Lysinibacillus capsici]MDP1415732.1 hypothetical protein [Lysinibacillus capsici]MDP1431589.1 hypothetical protein [Lysinibacillus capsici]
MSPREAFKVFIRYQLSAMKDEGKIDLTAEDIEKFANGIEDDEVFYNQLGDFLADYIDTFSTNYGIAIEY